MPEKTFVARHKTYFIQTLSIEDEWVTFTENLDKEVAQQAVEQLNQSSTGQFRVVEKITSLYVLSNRPEEEE